MKSKKDLAKKNILFFFELLEKKFYTNYNKFYIKNILDISKRFNVRLKREDKLKFCKKCLTYFTIDTREILFDKFTKTKNYICKNCGYVKKIVYKN